MPRAMPETTVSPGRAEVRRQPLREVKPVGRRVARPHHGDALGREQVHAPAQGEHRRRVVDGGERQRIGGLADGDQVPAEPVQRLDLALGGGARAQTLMGRRRPPRRASAGSASSTAAGEPKRSSRAKKVIGPDVLAAREAQPVEPLGVGQRAGLVGEGNVHWSALGSASGGAGVLRPIRGSRPRARRTIFAPWRSVTMTARKPASHEICGMSKRIAKPGDAQIAIKAAREE